MKTEEIALSRVSENEANPREISQANFQKLVQSIIVFPRMLTLRPIVIDETFHALGGNMRLKALQHIVTMDEAGIQVNAGCREPFEGETGEGDEPGNKREVLEVLHDERSRLHEVVLEQSAGSALAIQDVRRGNVAS